MEKKIVDFLKEKVASLEAIYMFGSAIENEGKYFNDDSDVDIAILCSLNKNIADIYSLKQDLEVILNRNIDLIDINKSDLVLRFEIISRGKKIYQNNNNADYIEDLENLTWFKYVKFSDERSEIIKSYLDS